MAEIRLEIEMPEQTFEAFRNMRESLEVLSHSEPITLRDGLVTHRDYSASPCHTCAYYSGDSRLPCAVHPMGPDEAGCGEWGPQ